MIPKITLRQLAIFVSVYQHSSTSQASQQLHLSQSAVSTAIQQLEDRLGMPLFERVGRGLVRHNNADAVYEQAQAMLAQADNLQHYQNQLGGSLSIGASTTIATYALPKLLASFVDDSGYQPIKVTVANSEEVVNAVASLQLDIGLIEATPHPTNINNMVIEPWQTDELVIFAKKNSRWLTNQHQPINNDKKQALMLSQQALSRLPLIVRELGSGTRQVINEKLLIKLKNTQVCMEVENSETIKKMVLADLGIGCLSHHIVQQELIDGQLTRLHIKDIELTRTWWVIWHKKRYQSALWQRFFKVMQLG